MADKVTPGAAVPEGIGPQKTFPPLDPGTFVPQLFWLALTFGLLYLLVKRLVLPRVGSVIDERRGRIERDLARAESLKVETEQALAGYEQALGEARAKAGTIGKEMHERLAAEIDKERAKVDAEIASRLADAEARIAQSKARAMAGVGEIAGDTAGAIVARLLGKEPSKDEVQRALMQRAAE
jgi:F-type H+-transporting ATPase subunit b